MYSMTKIKKSITINADLDNALGRLSTRLDQSNSQLIELILRKDDRIDALLTQLNNMDEMPDHTPELNRKITA